MGIDTSAGRVHSRAAGIPACACQERRVEMADQQARAMAPRTPFDQTPCNRLLGLQLVSAGPDRTEVLLPVHGGLLQEEGVVHGGLIAALADTAAVYLLLPALGDQRTATSIEFKLNFLGAARPEGGPLRAVGTLLRRGGTVAVCEAEVFQADRRIAKGSFTYLLRDQP
jgi:uncharacterized protein (TIGR00369 family)